MKEKVQLEPVRAALVVIGNEVLSGRTRDANLQYLGKQLNNIGIRLMEVRIIPDVEVTIIETINSLRRNFDYVFTTGGIGPTHDDITAISIAKAFGLELVLDHEAERRVRSNYHGPEEITAARLKMAYVPAGSRLLDNPVSKSPGFQVDNVFVLPGVPHIMQAMFQKFCGELRRAEPMISLEVSAFLPEGLVGGPLGEIQERHPEVEIGSYPFARNGRFGAAFVIRHCNESIVKTVGKEICAMIRSMDEEPIEN
ncbi:MAG: competence/damage-inducible protein A [Rhodospirillaceae bacterium TMED8]|nr:competence/damage-inducible protein A [Magnetovibrio sp.]OUT50803.1 MAG: competence/damage-inducible protein A [Rhodospirillaceae bacterium TMED8]|tara:strand:+ start:599 stop:1360 length:762 start_codon:yes stop_codon:yes gene_type:complete